MRWSRLLLPGLLACLYACGLISGAADLVVSPDAPDGETPREASSSSSADGSPDSFDAGVAPEPTCEAPAHCLAAPAGWEGPFAVFFNQATGPGAACPAGFARSWERVGAAQSTAPPAQCTCGCGAIGGTCTVTFVDYDEENCSGQLKTRTLQPDTCVKRADDSDGWKASAAPHPACPVDASTKFTPLDASTSAVGCAPGSSVGCEVGACVPPTPSGGHLCIRATTLTEQDCPAAWSERRSLEQSLEDTRGCSPCTCTATDPTCSFTYTLYDSTNCTSGAHAESDTACHAPDDTESVKLNAASVGGSCAPNGGQPVGGVTSSPAVVLCCQPSANAH